MDALIVDDEAAARRRLRGVLQGIPAIARIEECASGRAAIQALRRARPALVFLDIQMPDADGFAVAAAADRERPPAVVFVTAFDQPAARAFEVQAFDYILKPFDDARVIETVRRAARFFELARGGAAPVESFGAVRVDIARHAVTRHGRPVELRPKEYALLAALLRRGGGAASRVELLREVWGYADEVVSRTVDTHVAALRRKLEDDPSRPRHLVTVRAFGYRIER